MSTDTTTPGTTIGTDSTTGAKVADPLKPETAEEELIRRRAVASANDDADASHEGGMGAQGGAVDFGNPKNFGS